MSRPREFSTFSTFLTVLRVEAYNLWAERTVRHLLLVLTVLVATAAWAGCGHVAARKAAVADQQAAESAQRAAFALRGPTEAAAAGRDHLSHIAVRAGSPLAAIAPVGLHSEAVRITTESRRLAPGQTPLIGPTALATGAFDLAFVFVYLLPFLIIALTYDLLAGERERGTLALVMSQPVALRTFVLGKAALRALVVIGSTVFITGAALWGVADALHPDRLTAVALALAAVATYALFWFAAAVLVNAYGRSAAGNALALVGLWLVLVVVLPGLGRVALEVVYPPPPRTALTHQIRSAAAELEEQLRDLEGDHGGTAPAGRLLAVQVAVDARIEPVLDKFREQQTKQQAGVDTLRFFSPAVALHEALVDLAGSGVTHQRRFESELDRFHAEWRAHFAARAGSVLSPDELTQLPRFEAPPEPSSALVARVSVVVLSLLATTGLLILFAIPGLRRAGRLV